MAFYFSENIASHDGIRRIDEIQRIPLPWEDEEQEISLSDFMNEGRNENDYIQWSFADLVAFEPPRRSLSDIQVERDMNTPFDSIPSRPGIDDPATLNHMVHYFAPEHQTTGRAPRTRTPAARRNPLQRGKSKKGKEIFHPTLGSIPEGIFNAFLPSPAECGLDKPFTVQQCEFYINRTGIDLSSIFNSDILSGDTCLPDEEHDCLPSDEVFGLGRPLTDTEARFYLEQTSTSIGDYCHEINEPYPYNHSGIITDDL
jgi:hypothetical protein